MDRPNETSSNEEWATLIRVRNRLSNAPDAALPKILAGLLPRLLRRLEDYQQSPERQRGDDEASTSSPAIFDCSTTHATTAQILQQLTGILSQALERLEHDLKILPATPWMEAVLPFLSVTTTTTNGTINQHIITTTFALKFLQAGLARYRQEMGANSTTAFLDSIALTLYPLANVLYRQQQQLDVVQPLPTTPSNSSSASLKTAQRTLWFMASWLVLDVIAIYQGIDPFQDWDTDVVMIMKESKSPDDTDDSTGTTTKLLSAATVTPMSSDIVSDGGMMNLLLDVLLFSPDQDDNDLLPWLGLQRQWLVRLEPFLNRARNGVVQRNVEQEMQDELDRRREEQLQAEQPQQEPPLWPRIESKRGLSSEGEYRLSYRNELVTKKAKMTRNNRNPQRHPGADIQTKNAWNDAALFYLKQLKLASLQYSIGSSPQQGGGLFQGDAALLLAIVAMMSSSAQSAHARLGREYINKLSLLKVQRPKPSDFLKTGIDRHPLIDYNNSELQRVSLSLVCSLMILVIGDAAAAPVLEQFQATSSVWESILGPRPKSLDLSHCRPPLPPTIVAPMMDFISSLFLTTSIKLMVASFAEEENIEQKVMLLLHLLLASEPQFHQDNIWVVHIVHGMYHRVMQQHRENQGDPPKDWTIELSRKCLQVVINHLNIMAKWSFEPDPQQRQPNQNPEEMPFAQLPAHGRHLDLLVERHRSQQKKKFLVRPRATNVRACTYNLISHLAKGEVSRQIFLQGDEVSFELPDLLFTCAETEPAKSDVVAALEDVLKVYRRRILAPDAMSKGIELEALSAPLLRTLVTAACSHSPAIRLVSAKWICELLSHMDSMSAYTLGRFMIDDPDPRVSQYVAQGTWYSKEVGLNLKQVKDVPVEFVDLSNDVERSLLDAELEANVQRLATSLEIPAGAASLLLYDFHFKLDEVLQSTVSNRHDTLEKVGLMGRCNQNDSKDNMDIDDALVCGICYEEYEGESFMYSLPCRHTFCRECWKGLIDTNVEESSTKILTLTCPRQDCSERLTLEDLQSISPDFTATWRRAFLHSYVERSQHRRRFCPGPDCKMIAVAPPAGPQATPSAVGASVKCSQCKTQFCLSCGEPPHIPARCDDMTKFHRMYSSSTYYVHRYTKPCPGCKAAVDKDGGCNAMFCTQCNASFCWICLSLVDAHLPHTCNKYGPDTTSEEARFAFYSERYQAHDHAEGYAQKQINNLEERAKDISHAVWDTLHERDFATFRIGLETLFQARRFLKYSYIYSFGKSSSGKSHSVFETYQAALEASTEALSRLTELDLDKIYEEYGSQGIHSHVGQLGMYTAFVNNSMQRILSLG